MTKKNYSDPLAMSEDTWHVLMNALSVYEEAALTLGAGEKEVADAKAELQKFGVFN